MPRQALGDPSVEDELCDSSWFGSFGLETGGGGFAGLVLKTGPWWIGGQVAASKRLASRRNKVADARKDLNSFAPRGCVSSISY